MNDDRSDLISRLFALLTAQLEDSVTLALDGQGRQALVAQHERAQSLEAQVRDVQTIARVLVILTQPSRSEGDGGMPASY